MVILEGKLLLMYMLVIVDPNFVLERRIIVMYCCLLCYWVGFQWVIYCCKMCTLLSSRWVNRFLRLPSRICCYKGMGEYRSC